MTIGSPAMTSEVSRWWNAIARRSVRGTSDVALVLLDAVLVATAFTAMLTVRYELAVPAEAWAGFGRFVPVAVGLQLIVNRLAGLYGPVWQQASVLEAQRILGAGAITSLALTVWVTTGSRLVPLSVALTGGLVATGLLGVLRFQSRLFAFHRRQGSTATRVLIVGAGESGGALLRELSRRPDAAARRRRAQTWALDGEHPHRR